MTSPTRSEHTGGRFSLVEYLKPPGDTTPLHVHHHESQTTEDLTDDRKVELIAIAAELGIQLLGPPGALPYGDG